MFDIGRICMKTAGREAGRYCVVVAKEKDKEFLLITGPKAATKVRRRKCNINHLEPTPLKIEIKENAPDEHILEAYEKEDIYSKLRILKPGEVPVERQRKEEKAEEKHEESKEREEKAEHAHEHKAEKKEHKHEEHKEHEHKAEHKEAKPKKTRAKKAKKE